MWEHPFVACVDLIFWRGEGWFCCLFFQHVLAVIPLIRGAQVHGPCACPWEGWGSSWLPVGGPLVQAAGCTREMRTVISAVSWDLCWWWAACAPRNVGTVTRICSQDPLQWQWSIPLEPYMAVVAQACPCNSCRWPPDAWEHVQR